MQCDTESEGAILGRAQGDSSMQPMADHHWATAGPPASLGHSRTTSITGPQQDHCHHRGLASFTFNKDFLGDLSHLCKSPMKFASSSEGGGQGHYLPS